MAMLTIPFFHGTMVYRWSAWLLAWQVMTPTREWWFDIPLMGIGFAVLEWTWRKAND